MEQDILKEIYEALKKGEKVALATITENIGSTPRKLGSIMAVFKDGTILGSVGGGAFEGEVIKKSLDCIVKGEDSDFDHNLGAKGNLGMQCGGGAKGYIKVFKPKPRLVIAGAGHIGEALNKLAKFVGFETVIIDDRIEYANKHRYPDADEIIVGDIGEKLSEYKLNEDSYVVIVTKGHIPDRAALEAVVKKDAAYIGMIGSKKKVLYVIEKVLENGVSKKDLDKVYTPIGLDIASELPNEIAVSIMAEMLAIKNKGTLNHKKFLWKEAF